MFLFSMSIGSMARQAAAYAGIGLGMIASEAKADYRALITNPDGSQSIVTRPGNPPADMPRIRLNTADIRDIESRQLPTKPSVGIGDFERNQINHPQRPFVTEQFRGTRMSQWGAGGGVQQQQYYRNNSITINGGIHVNGNNNNIKIGTR